MESIMSYLFPTYKKKDIQLTQGKGAFLYSQDGKRYLDFMSGIAVTNLGHNHPSIVQALHKQADLLWHGSNLFHYEVQEQAAKQLVEKKVVVMRCFSAIAVQKQMKQQSSLLEKLLASHILYR